MPSSCNPPNDCNCIRSNVSYYQSAVAYDQAAVALAQTELSNDQTGYYYWLMQSYQYGCGTMAMPPGHTITIPTPNPVSAERAAKIKDDMDAIREKHIKEIQAEGVV